MISQTCWLFVNLRNEGSFAITGFSSSKYQKSLDVCGCIYIQPFVTHYTTPTVLHPPYSSVRVCAYCVGQWCPDPHQWTGAQSREKVGNSPSLFCKFSLLWGIFFADSFRSGYIFWGTLVDIVTDKQTKINDCFWWHSQTVQKVIYIHLFNKFKCWGPIFKATV